MCMMEPLHDSKAVVRLIVHLVLLELGHHVLQQRIVKVLATKESVTVGRLDLATRSKARSNIFFINTQARSNIFSQMSRRMPTTYILGSFHLSQSFFDYNVPQLFRW